VPAPYLPALRRLLDAATTGMDARWLGSYALNSLRLEKGFGIWSREFTRDYTPRMAGLGRFIAYDKSAFIGREAALADRDSTPPHQLVSLAIDADDADAAGYEPILAGKELVGYVTSGGYGHCARRSLALGYLASQVGADAALTVNVLGEPRAATLLQQPLIDPSGSRMRS
jgi:dimethylglycine dehydrogenase